MSILRVVRCDVRGCGREQSVPPRRHGRFLQVIGWLKQNGKYICPFCQSAGKVPPRDGFAHDEPHAGRL